MAEWLPAQADALAGCQDMTWLLALTFSLEGPAVLSCVLCASPQLHHPLAPLLDPQPLVG